MPLILYLTSISLMSCLTHLGFSSYKRKSIHRHWRLAYEHTPLGLFVLMLVATRAGHLPVSQSGPRKCLVGSLISVIMVLGIPWRMSGYDSGLLL